MTLTSVLGNLHSVEIRHAALLPVEGSEVKTADRYLHTSLTVLARTLASPSFPSDLVSSGHQNLFLPQELFSPPARRSDPVSSDVQAYSQRYSSVAAYNSS